VFPGFSFPFRGWWVPSRAVRRAWASPASLGVAARPVRLPSRVPVWVLWRVGPRGRLFVAVSSSVSVASGRGPRGAGAWSAAWRRFGGVPRAAVLALVPARASA
jgi:hypothetical protein